MSHEFITVRLVVVVLTSIVVSLAVVAVPILHETPREKERRERTEALEAQIASILAEDAYPPWFCPFFQDWQTIMAQDYPGVDRSLPEIERQCEEPHP